MLVKFASSFSDIAYLKSKKSRYLSYLFKYYMYTFSKIFALKTKVLFEEYLT